MKKKIITYTSIVLGIFVLLITYLSTVGIETEKFNNQIQNLVKQKNEIFTNIMFILFIANIYFWY